ncbi:malignant T-cell-amplified sequence 1 [Platysternon megacephalum]|uniref:Malignant T-cell-amplified sequence 1 n=1 Tax=Platysternon megacephalum TaxID=55544 RepID=A0A4D9F5K7_9SAUR|nr:malignant T-cell-amplified sequence 1 [Platysternon megacephalum]
MCTMLRPALFIYYKWNLFDILCLYLTVSLIKLLLLVINEIATKYCLCFMQHYLNYSCIASGDLHFKMLPWPNVYSYSVFFANKRHCRLRREILYCSFVLNVFIAGV